MRSVRVSMTFTFDRVDDSENRDRFSGSCTNQSGPASFARHQGRATLYENTEKWRLGPARRSDKPSRRADEARQIGHKGVC